MTRFSKRRMFTESALSELCESGWIFSLPSRPDHLLIGWGGVQATSELWDVAVYAPDFRLASQTPWLVSKSWDLLDRKSFANLIRGAVDASEANEKQQFQWLEPDFAVFAERFEKIQNRLRGKGSHTLKKAVPVVFSTADFAITALRRKLILEKMATLPDSLFIYGFWGCEGSAKADGMMGATPEVLFSMPTETKLETMALAGTRAKTPHAGNTQFESSALLNDPKERQEHQFVIDDIAEVLKDVAEVEIGRTDTVELPTLFHLQTPISARLRKSLSLKDAARRLHPTPALGVAPRSLGFTEMAEWDDLALRLRFGAPFGVIAPEIRDCVVAIRNIQWQAGRVLLGSGCGVVAASELEREWQELSLKRESVKRMLGV